LRQSYYQQGRFDLAVTHWTEAVRLKPDEPVLLNKLAWILAVSEETGIADPAQAVTLAERACSLTNYRHPDKLDTLAAAYAAAGNFAKAIETAEKAAQIAASAGNEEMAHQIKKRIQLYKAGQPYIEPLMKKAAIEQ
jgi:Flp pilus assembly protein TadD